MVCAHAIEVFDMNLELGAFEKRDGWITLDLHPDSDIRHDLLKPLPFGDNSVDQIYTSHLLEHFFFADIIKILKECYRVLVPNGVFSSAVPNMRPYIEAYFSPEKEFVPPHEIDKDHLHYFSRIDLINYMGSLNGLHKWMFDDENLPLIVKSVGFEEVKIREFKDGLDLLGRKDESIYVEGIKQC